jgi:hypothetical protein
MNFANMHVRLILFEGFKESELVCQLQIVWYNTHKPQREIF